MEERKHHDLKCVTESDVTVLGLDTYLHTKNGWTVTGPSLLEVAEGTPAHALAVTAEESDETLNHQLERPWRIHSVPEDEAHYTPEELSGH